MKFAKKVCMTFVIALSFIGSGMAQEYGRVSQEVGKVGYSGNFTPAEIMEAEASKFLSIDPEAKISFDVSIPVVKNGQVLIRDTAGLPLNKAGQDSVISSATLVIPFHVDEFKLGASFDSISFLDHVSETLSRIPKTQKPQSEKSGSPKQMSVLNSPNCGGYPLGTTITVITDSCIFGTYTNKYSCNTNPVTGGNDWYVISSSWIAPNCTVH